MMIKSDFINIVYGGFRLMMIIISKLNDDQNDDDGQTNQNIWMVKIKLIANGQKNYKIKKKE